MTWFAALSRSLPRFCYYWSQEKTVITALEMGGLWGPTLTVSLHVDILLRGRVPLFFFAKTILTSVVLYLVASFSYAHAAMDREATEE